MNNNLQTKVIDYLGLTEFNEESITNVLTERGYYVAKYHGGMWIGYAIHYKNDKYFGYAEARTKIDNLTTLCIAVIKLKIGRVYQAELSEVENG